MRALTPGGRRVPLVVIIVVVATVVVVVILVLVVVVVVASVLVVRVARIGVVIASVDKQLVHDNSGTSRLHSRFVVVAVTGLVAVFVSVRVVVPVIILVVLVILARRVAVAIVIGLAPASRVPRHCCEILSTGEVRAGRQRNGEWPAWDRVLGGWSRGIPTTGSNDHRNSLQVGRPPQVSAMVFGETRRKKPEMNFLDPETETPTLP